MKKSFFLLIPIFVYALCPNKLYKDKNPDIKLFAQEVCFEQYGVLYSYDFLVPIASFEKLTKSSVEKSTKLHRVDAFHTETKIPKQFQVSPKDYSNTGFDKGHMSPCDDMPTQNAQYESFSMVNMVPQTHHNNAGVWKTLEEKMRTLAKSGDIYVVSGPIIDTTNKKLKRGIIIPSKLYKAYYQPSTGLSGVYVSYNDTVSENLETFDLKTFKTKYGIDPFPALSIP